MDLKELHDKVQTNWAEMRAYIDEQQREIKAHGEERGEIKATIDRLSTQISALEDKVKQTKAEKHRPRLADPDAFDEENPWGNGEGLVKSSRRYLSKKARETHDLYFKSLRVGIGNMFGDEREAARQFLTGTGDRAMDDRARILITEQNRPGEAKALSVGDDTAGGYLAPPEFIQDIIKGVQLISPVRPLAQVRQTSRRSIQYPVRSGVFAAKWVQETGTRSETAGLTYALEEIPNYEMYADVLVSDQDLEDAVFNLEQEILDNCTEQFAKAEGAAFINGSGVGQPEGILTNTSVTSDAYTMAASGANAHTLGPSMFLTTWGNLKTVYAKNATWLMNRATIVQVRGLVDGQGRYLWEPGLADGTPPNLLGSPYIEIPDMPNVKSSSGSSVPVAYGNIKRAYLIVDRINVVVRRLQEKYAESGQIAYLVRKRVGGQVVLPEAVRTMTVTYA